VSETDGKYYMQSKLVSSTIDPPQYLTADIVIAADQPVDWICGHSAHPVARCRLLI